MPYTEKVKFTKTGQYGCGPVSEDDVYTVEEFRELSEDDVYTVEEFREFCEQGMLIDYDGFGHPVRDRLADVSIAVYPSRLHTIPEDATHIVIVWYNR